jgi:uncharacterized protein (TIGR00369 family)
VKEVVRYPGCFVCGEKNVHGLRARFFFDGREAFTEVVCTEDYEGYRGIFHGGLIASLLDEVMIKAILAQEYFAVTAELTVRFIRPVLTGQTIRCAGRIVKSRGRVYLTEGSATGPDGETYATATGKYVEAGSSLKEQLVKSID